MVMKKVEIKMTRQQKYKIQTIARYIILIAVGLVMIYPMIWMVRASFKQPMRRSLVPSVLFRRSLRWTAIKTAGSPVPISLADMVNTYKFVIPKVIGTVVPQPLQHMVSRFSLRLWGFWLH